MGSVVISIDAELGWGFHDRDSPPTDRLANARSGWRMLVDLCDAYEVPATWAVVGHLFLRDCDGRHEDLPSLEGWFRSERGPNRLPRSLRFGDGLVEYLLNADTDHDIGSHTFSHVEFGVPAVTDSIARAEVRESIACARERGCSPTSFVFPRNNIGHTHVLESCGMRAYRGPCPTGYADRGVTTKLATAIGNRDVPPLVVPRIGDHGLVVVPTSMYLFAFEGRVRDIVKRLVGDPIVRQAKRGIDAATKSDGVFHIWLHPNNIVGETERRRVRSILRYIEHRRFDTSLTVETMASLAAKTLAEAAG